MMNGSENTDGAVFQLAVDRIKDLARAVIQVKALAEEERGEIGDIPGVVVLVGDKYEKGPSVASKQNDGDASAEYGALWWDEELSDLGVGSGLEVVFWDPKGATEDPSARNEYGGNAPSSLGYTTMTS